MKFKRKDGLTACQRLITALTGCAPEELLPLDAEKEKQVVGLFNCLTERQREVIVGRCGFGRDRWQSQDELSLILDISATRVQQLEKKALRKLRQDSFLRHLGPVTLPQQKRSTTNCLDLTIEELEGLSERAHNALKNGNIKYVRELVQQPEEHMLRTYRFGRKTVSEIKAVLAPMNLSLGMQLDEQGRIMGPSLPAYFPE
jgi:hypothetical protein